jgi:hypothetical protein
VVPIKSIEIRVGKSFQIKNVEEVIVVQNIKEFMNSSKSIIQKTDNSQRFSFVLEILFRAKVKLEVSIRSLTMRHRILMFLIHLQVVQAVHQATMQFKLEVCKSLMLAEREKELNHTFAF